MTSVPAPLALPTRATRAFMTDPVLTDAGSESRWGRRILNDLADALARSVTTARTGRDAPAGRRCCHHPPFRCDKIICVDVSAHPSNAAPHPGHRHRGSCRVV